MLADDILLPKNTTTAPTSSLSRPSVEPEPASNTHLNALLEKLPSEVRRAFLSKLELKELSALVHASPVFHQQYLLDRRFLLCTCLETSLHSSSIAIDVCAAYRTGLTDFSDTRTNDKVIHYLQSYQDRYSLAEYSIFIEGLTESEVVEVSGIRHSIAPLSRDCWRAAQNSF